ncbi:MAG: hypothetical protein ACK5MD_09725, partial [Flavobacteriales bacterium]
YTKYAIRILYNIIKQTPLTLEFSQYEFWQGSHRNKSVIWIKFPKDFQLLGELKKHTKPI